MFLDPLRTPTGKRGQNKSTERAVDMNNVEALSSDQLDGPPEERALGPPSFDGSPSHRQRRVEAPDQYTVALLLGRLAVAPHGDDCHVMTCGGDAATHLVRVGGALVRISGKTHEAHI